MYHYWLLCMYAVPMHSQRKGIFPLIQYTVNSPSHDNWSLNVTAIVNESYIIPILCIYIYIYAIYDLKNIISTRSYLPSICGLSTILWKLLFIHIHIFPTLFWDFWQTKLNLRRAVRLYLERILIDTSCEYYVLNNWPESLHTHYNI